MKNKKMNEILINLLESAENAIKVSLEKADKGGFVVESSNWVNVGKELGWNGTEFAGKDGIMCQYARVFQTPEEAERCGADYNLKDQFDEPVIMEITPAEEFFGNSALRLEVLVDYFKEKIKDDYETE